MNTISDILRDADPLRHEPKPTEADRDRVRRTVMAAATGAAASRAHLFARAAAVAAVAMVVAALVASGSRNWFDGTVQAQQIRFEVRLAEERPAAGLRQARVGDRTVYLHPEVIVTNGDIAQSSVVSGDGPARFGVSVHFTGAGAEKMRKATAGHIGRLMAILMDGTVVTAPVVRSEIGDAAMITGSYARADAERIAAGLDGR